MFSPRHKSFSLTKGRSFACRYGGVPDMCLYGTACAAYLVCMSIREHNIFAFLSPAHQRHPVPRKRTFHPRLTSRESCSAPKPNSSMVKPSHYGTDFDWCWRLTVQSYVLEIIDWDKNPFLIKETGQTYCTYRAQAIGDDIHQQPWSKHGNVTENVMFSTEELWFALPLFPHTNSTRLSSLDFQYPDFRALSIGVRPGITSGKKCAESRTIGYRANRLTTTRREEQEGYPSFHSSRVSNSRANRIACREVSTVDVN